MKSSVNIISLFILLLISSCSSSKKEKPSSVSEVVFEQDVLIVQNNSDQKKVTRGESLYLTDETPVLVELPGHVSVMIVPLKGKAKASVRLRELSARTMDPVLKDEQNISLSRILQKITLAQNFLQNKKASEALNIVDQLLAENGQLVYLNFLKASCHFLLGQKEMTRSALDLALRIHPDFKEAIELYNLVLNSGEKNPYSRNKL